MPNSNAAQFSPILPHFTASSAPSINSSDQEFSFFGWLEAGRAAARFCANAEQLGFTF